MANIYYSAVDGNDADDGSTWALAKATLAGALTIAADGDTIYADSAGTEAPTANYSINHPVANGKVYIISVDRNGSSTTGHNGWLKGATIALANNVTGLSICSSGAQIQYHYGMIYKSNGGVSSSNIFTICSGSTGTENRNIMFDNCELHALGTNGAGTLQLGQGTGTGTGGCNIVLKGTQIVIRNSSTASTYGMRLHTADIRMNGVTISYAGASKPPALFGGNADGLFSLEIMDSDLSGYENGSGAYFDVAAMRGYSIIVRNCKLSSSPAVVTGTWLNNSLNITLINTDSGDTRNVFEYRNRLGTITEDTANYASSGATFDSTNISWKIVTTASCNEAEPFTCPWLMRWGSSTSAQTHTIEFVHDSATNMHDRNIWAEFERVSDASFPLGTLLSIRNATPFDGSSADHAAGAATWTLSPSMTNENKQKLSSGSITPAEKSLLRARVYVGVASKTLYVDPFLRVA